MKQDKITKQKLEKYYALTSKALAIAKKAIAKSKQKQAKEIIKMVECYLSDSQHFKQKQDYVNAYGCLIMVMPGEKLEDMQKTIDFIDFGRKNGASRLWAQILIPLFFVARTAFLKHLTSCPRLIKASVESLADCRPYSIQTR